MNNKDSNPLIYIIMPVYNREFSVERSVSSIIAQTYSSWELMIVDDGSTDNSLDLIKKLAATDERITFKTNTEYSHSAAGARLSGLLDKHGEYIAFLDSDDEWPDYHLATMLNALAQDTSIDFIFGDLRRIDLISNQIKVASKFKNENGLPEDILINWNGNYGIIQDKDILEKSIRHRFNTGLHTAVFRKNVFDKITLKETKTGEDFIFTLEAIKAQMKIAVSKDIHLNYYIHENNISNSNASNSITHQLNNLLIEASIYEDIIPNVFNLSTAEEKARKSALSEQYMWHIGYSMYRKNNLYFNALKYAIKAIKLCPTKIAYYKTFTIYLALYLASSLYKAQNRTSK